MYKSLLTFLYRFRCGIFWCYNLQRFISSIGISCGVARSRSICGSGSWINTTIVNQCHDQQKDGYFPWQFAFYFKICIKSNGKDFFFLEIYRTLKKRPLLISFFIVSIIHESISWNTITLKLYKGFRIAGLVN